MKTCIGLINEFEGDSTLYFDVNDPETPQRLVSYIVDNIEKGEKREFIVEDLSDEEFKGLE